MKKNTKAVALVLAALLLALSLSGCAKDDGILTVSTSADWPPYEYFEGGEIVGIDAEIAAALAEKLDMELKIEDMDWTAVLASVAGGKSDIAMSCLTITPDRELEVNFSDVYATGVQVVIVPEGGKITSLDDLGGEDVAIGVQINTTGDLLSTDDYGETADIQRYPKAVDAIQALVQGKVDAVIIDSQPADVFVEQNKGLSILETKYTDEEYAIAINKKNTKLLKDINAALAELKTDGTIDAIIEKYIPTNA